MAASLSDTVRGDAAVLERTRAHLGRSRAQLADVLGSLVEERSQGARLWTTDGQEFLNVGGYGVFLLGARHPRVVDAVTAQLGRHPLTTRALLEPAGAAAAEALTSVAPDGLRKVYFAGAGTEAVEAALKMACTLGRHHLVGARNGYHGKTLGALSLTANPIYQGPFEPLLRTVEHVPFGDIEAMAAVVREDSCVVLEPVQGEGGVNVPPPGYLRQVERLCRERGALLVLDEIMTGLGRTGRWWAGDRDGVTPDILLSGKSLGGGVLPVSAAIATEEVFAALDADLCLHTSTFSGAPLGMAAATAAIAAIRDEGLVERAADLGGRLHAALTEIRLRVCPDLLVDVRGEGLLIGLEFADPGLAGAFIIELIEARVIANHSLNAGPVIRLTPPAVLDAADETWLLEAVERACANLRSYHGQGGDPR